MALTFSDQQLLLIITSAKYLIKSNTERYFLQKIAGETVYNYDITLTNFKRIKSHRVNNIVTFQKLYFMS